MPARLPIKLVPEDHARRRRRRRRYAAIILMPCRPCAVAVSLIKTFRLFVDHRLVLNSRIACAVSRLEISGFQPTLR